MAQLYSVKDVEFNIYEIKLLFTEVDVSKVSSHVAQKPLAGQVFMYNYQQIDTRDDWVADGYR